MGLMEWPMSHSKTPPPPQGNEARSQENTKMNYIIQDAYTGYIWGDTRDFNDGPNHYDSIIDACRALDETNGDHGCTYEEVPRLSGDTGYIVYEVNAGGSEAVVVVHDGQDPETIADVEDNCIVAGYVERRSADQ